MSYILDALKRADAERERGQVPGLHAQPIENMAGSERSAGLPRWALVAGGGTALVVVAALAWRMGADAHAPLPVPMTAAPEPAPAPAPVVAATPAVEAPAPVVEAARPTPEPAPPPVAYIPPPRPAPRPTPERKPTAAPTAPAPTPVATRAPEPAPTATVPMLAELPGSVRQQLPALTVTGSVYSDDASSRFIMLNGEVVKEGGQPAPGVVVERIEQKSAVLRFKGQRFRLPF